MTINNDGKIKIMVDKFVFENTVNNQYDSKALLYARKFTMQLGNLKNLLKYLLNNKIRLRGGKLLDLGCGNGIFMKEIKNELNFLKTIKNYWTDYSYELLKLNLRRMIYYGIDRAYKSLEIGKSLGMLSDNVVVADARCLCFKNEVFDIVISNSVLHWLNVPEEMKTPRRALEEVFRILKRKGCLAISVSGYGTAERFQDSYRKVLKNYGNELWFDISKVRFDPIGSMHLNELVKMLIDIGYKIKNAKLKYEPVDFENPGEYVNHVEGYGYEPYLATILESRKEEVWAEIKSNFIEKVGNVKYKHDQYMIYMIALKE